MASVQDTTQRPKYPLKPYSSNGDLRLPSLRELNFYRPLPDIVQKSTTPQTDASNSMNYPISNKLRLPSLEELNFYRPVPNDSRGSTTPGNRDALNEQTQGAHDRVSRPIQWNHFNRSASVQSSVLPHPQYPQHQQSQNRQHNPPLSVGFDRIPDVEHNNIAPVNTDPATRDGDALTQDEKPGPVSTTINTAHNRRPPHGSPHPPNHPPSNASSPFHHILNQYLSSTSITPTAATTLPQELSHNITVSNHLGYNDPQQQQHSPPLGPTRVKTLIPNIDPAVLSMFGTERVSETNNLMNREGKVFPPSNSLPPRGEPLDHLPISSWDIMKEHSVNVFGREKIFDHPRREAYDDKNTHINQNSCETQSGVQDLGNRDQAEVLGLGIPSAETASPAQGWPWYSDETDPSTWQLDLQHLKQITKHDNTSSAALHYKGPHLPRRRPREEEDSIPELVPIPKMSLAPMAKRARLKDRPAGLRIPLFPQPTPLFLIPTEDTTEEVETSREMLLSEWFNDSQEEPDRILVETLLDQLAGILKTPGKRKALQGLKGNNAQTLIDFLYWALLWQRIPSQTPWLRKHILMVLCKLSGASTLYPHWYVLKDIVYQSREDSGGFCDIHKGRFGDSELCLKVIRVPQRSQLEKMLKIYAKEAILWGQLHHRNITPFYGVFYLDNIQKTICLVSPWMKNGNIVTYLEHNAAVPRKPLIGDISCGLKYLHDENVIHADLKGMNVLVSDSGRACITDFGISTIWSDRTLGFTHTTGGVVARSTRWAAPELLEKGEVPTRASDVWAFGCVCYEVLTRKVPFQECATDTQILVQLIKGEPPAQKSGDVGSDALDGVDDGMWELMKWCWGAKPSERPTCDQILQRLERQGLAVNTELELVDQVRFVRESQYLQAMLGENSDTKIDMAKVREILNDIHAVP